uniref:Putative ovule protein n=1 Tax=Solanum chacoense TaxID=4108 RepID=A0A0V0H850_SOLCH
MIIQVPTHIDQTTPNPQKKDNKDIVPEPAPHTIIQSFVAQLRQNQAKNDIPIDPATPIITTRQGLPAGATTTHTNQQL